MRTFLLAALCIVTANGTISEAQLFKRAKARRAARQQQQACPGGVCPNPTQTGYLGINANGGFTGALPASAFTQPNTTYTQPATTLAQPGTMAPHIPANPQLIPAQPPAVVATAPTVAAPQEHSILVKVAKAAKAEASTTPQSNKAMLEALATNLKAMQTAVEQMAKAEAAQTASTQGDADVIAKLPILRVTVEARDGGEDRELVVDMAEVAREKLGLK